MGTEACVLNVHCFQFKTRLILSVSVELVKRSNVRYTPAKQQEKKKRQDDLFKLTPSEICTAPAQNL